MMRHKWSSARWADYLPSGPSAGAYARPMTGYVCRSWGSHYVDTDRNEDDICDGCGVFVEIEGLLATEVPWDLMGRYLDGKVTTFHEMAVLFRESVLASAGAEGLSLKKGRH